MSTNGWGREIDKSSWGDGAWQDEPDELDFNFGDVRCRIVRNPYSGTLNGYVALPPGHPWIGRDYDDLPITVHGGVTFSGKFADLTYGTKTDESWWIGFDTAHAWDLAPGFRRKEYPRGKEDSYKSIEYVRGECEDREASHSGDDVTAAEIEFGRG